MDISGKRFLVIGGAGLIGSHTVDYLLKNDVAEIRIYDNFCRGTLINISNALKDPRVNIFPFGGDILHRDILNKAMEGIDGVFHFAAMWLLHCNDFPRTAFDVNVSGTFNVIEAMIANGVKKIIFSSSASVYGDAIEEPMTEVHPYNNLNFYGATKISGEHICKSLYHTYKKTDKYFDYIGLRYMNVYGPRQDSYGAYIPVVMKMIDAIEHGEGPTIYGDGSEAYDFIAVEDCARANINAMKADKTDEFYNVSTGIRTTLKELAEKLLDLMGSDSEINYQQKRNHLLVTSRIGSPSKAKLEINFSPTVNLIDGLKKLCSWKSKTKLGLL